MVVCGLMIGNGGQERAMSDNIQRYIDMFWELVEEILNAVLFLLIGLEVILIAFSPALLLCEGLAIAVTLATRWLTVGLAIRASRHWLALPRGSLHVLVWGGLRGAILVALALSLPSSAGRETVLALTYCVVVFSILVLGLTTGKVVRTAITTPA